jgi:hypothetical protein
MRSVSFPAILAAAFIAGINTASAGAAVTTLSFSGDVCGASSDEACSNYSQIGQDYGDSSAMDVRYRSVVTATGATYTPYLQYWTQYADLPGIVFGGSDRNNYTSEIAFIPTAGFEVSLVGFDFATYLDRSASVPFSITSVGGADISSGTLPTLSPGHNSLALNSDYYSDGIILRWGPDGYDVGLDNIAFDVRAIVPGGAVPEASTWAMMIAGFGMVGGALRRRRPLLLSA